MPESTLATRRLFTLVLSARLVGVFVSLPSYAQRTRLIPLRTHCFQMALVSALAFVTDDDVCPVGAILDDCLAVVATCFGDVSSLYAAAWSLVFS